MTETHQVDRKISALGEVHALLGGYYERHGVDRRTAFCLDLAAEEILTNMVRHNQSEHDYLSMSVDVADDRIRLEWVDHDVEPFDPDSLPPVDLSLPVTERDPGGLGLHLVKSIVDRVTYEYVDGDLRVTVIKSLES